MQPPSRTIAAPSVMRAPDTDGVEVDTQGDAFFFAFPTAPGALAAAREAAERARTAVRSECGSASTPGTPLVTEEGYVGGDVHRAARIAAAGHGGQILVSTATMSLVGSTTARRLRRPRGAPLQGPRRARARVPARRRRVSAAPKPRTGRTSRCRRRRFSGREARAGRGRRASAPRRCPAPHVDAAPAERVRRGSRSRPRRRIGRVVPRRPVVGAARAAARRAALLASALAQVAAGRRAARSTS